MYPIIWNYIVWKISTVKTKRVAKSVINCSVRAVSIKTDRRDDNDIDCIGLLPLSAWTSSTK